MASPYREFRSDSFPRTIHYVTDEGTLCGQHKWMGRVAGAWMELSEDDFKDPKRHCLMCWINPKNPIGERKSALTVLLESDAAKKMLAEAKARFENRGPSPDLLFDFDHVMSAINVVETAIAANQAETQDWARKRAITAAQNPFTNFIEEGIFSGMAEPMWNASWTLPTILRRSLFLTVSTHTEHVLRSWCRSLRKDWGLAHDLPKKPPYLQNCMLFLRDHAGLAIDGYEHWPEWAVIDKNATIRNCLAHDGGRLRPNDLAKLKGSDRVIIEDDPHLAGEPFLNIPPGASEHAATKAKAFFQRLAAIAAADGRAKRS